MAFAMPRGASGGIAVDVMKLRQALRGMEPRVPCAGRHHFVFAVGVLYLSQLSWGRPDLPPQNGAGTGGCEVVVLECGDIAFAGVPWKMFRVI